MPRIPLIFFFITLVFYLTSFVFGVFYLFFKKEFLPKISTWSLRLGFLFHLSMFGAEWYYLGRFPLHKPAMIMVLVVLVLQLLTKKDLIYVILGSIPIVVGVMFLGLRRDPTIVLSTAHDSQWLITHIVFAWFSFGSFGVATVFSALYLIKSSKEDFLSEEYTLEWMDKFIYKLVALGVLFQAVMLMAGMMWGKSLFGRYWNWDRVEVWALIVFLFYLLYLHLRVFWGFKGKSAALMLFVGFFFLIISIWGLPFLISNEHLQNPVESLSR